MAIRIIATPHPANSDGKSYYNKFKGHSATGQSRSNTGGAHMVLPSLFCSGPAAVIVANKAGKRVILLDLYRVVYSANEYLHMSA